MAEESEAGTIQRLANGFFLRIAGKRFRAYSIVKHTGRSSGREDRNPVSAYPLGDGFVVPVLYGTGSQWVRNVKANSGFILRTKGRDFTLERPEIIAPSQALAAYPPLLRWTMKFRKIQTSCGHTGWRAEKLIVDQPTSRHPSVVVAQIQSRAVQRVLTIRPKDASPWSISVMPTNHPTRAAPRALRQLDADAPRPSPTSRAAPYSSRMCPAADRPRLTPPRGEGLPSADDVARSVKSALIAPHAVSSRFSASIADFIPAEEAPDAARARVLLCPQASILGGVDDIKRLEPKSWTKS